MDASNPTKTYLRTSDEKIYDHNITIMNFTVSSLPQPQKMNVLCLEFCTLILIFRPIFWPCLVIDRILNIVRDHFLLFITMLNPLCSPNHELP